MSDDDKERTCLLIGDEEECREQIEAEDDYEEDWEEIDPDCEYGTDGEDDEYDVDEPGWERRNEIKTCLASGKKIHRDILIVTYVFLALFLGTIVYLGYFSYTQSAGYLANPYNGKRASAFSERYIRGDILSADGRLLATTKTEDGKERRSYPFGRSFSHVVGYSSKGFTGLESLCSSYLLSSHINLFEIIKNEFSGRKTMGDSVITTLDSRMQKKAYKLLEGKRGAVIVSEVRTGYVLAMVSLPDFDPNTIAEDWNELVSDSTNSNLVNRAMQGLYPPGSTFKILPLLEYYREHDGDVSDFSFDCGGIYELGEYSIKCASQTEHGEEDIRDAFADSCNGAFALLGQQIDQKKLYKLCEDFGYNSPLPTDILNNSSRYDFEDTADTWLLLQTAIGQGDTLITPMQNLMIISAIANGGTAMKPTLLDSVVSAEGQVVKSFAPSEYKKIISPDEASFLGDCLRAVCTDGTGRNALTSSVKVAGKTGSAQWKNGENTHAWFVGYAPYDDPEIAVSIIVENAGSGGNVAAPMAKELFECYFD